MSPSGSRMTPWYLSAKISDQMMKKMITNYNIKAARTIWNLAPHGSAPHHKFVLSGQRELALMQPPPHQELPVKSI